MFNLRWKSDDSQPNLAYRTEAKREKAIKRTGVKTKTQPICSEDAVRGSSH